MTAKDDLKARVQSLVGELGDLIDDVTVVGGTSPSLYEMNDTVAVRPTRDVDLIVRSKSRVEWQRFVRRLEQRGFRYPAGEPICRYTKGDLVIDVMPSDATHLGFGNRWYEAAAIGRMKSPIARLHVVTPIYFIATKLDAFEDRGADHPRMSHDLEDIFVVLRGLPSLFDDVESGMEIVHAEVRRQLRKLCERSDALDLVGSMLEGDRATQALAPRLLARLRRACGATAGDGRGS